MTFGRYLRSGLPVMTTGALKAWHPVGRCFGTLILSGYSRLSRLGRWQCLMTPGRANPYADALEVIEFEQPYQLQFQVMGIAEFSCAAG